MSFDFHRKSHNRTSKKKTNTTNMKIYLKKLKFTFHYQAHPSTYADHWCVRDPRSRTTPHRRGAGGGGGEAKAPSAHGGAGRARGLRGPRGPRGPRGARGARAPVLARAGTGACTGRIRSGGPRRSCRDTSIWNDFCSIVIQ